jgi:tetratricopeptide (TPR) repeat protein
LRTPSEAATAEQLGRAGPGLFSRPWLRALVLCLAVALCYANSLRVPFLFDDPFVLASQLEVPLEHFPRPLWWYSFELNRAVSGGNTWSYHVFNALVHLACGLLLLGILRRTMARVAPDMAGETREGMAWATTLLWLCHPLQTASVTYLAQRAESMGALFYLAVLYAFLRSASSARPRAWQAATLVALALGFAAKETIATVPVALWLFDSLFLASGPWNALRLRRGFYAALALCTLVLSWFFILPLTHATSAGFGLEFGPLQYARTQPGVLLHYIRLAFWPHPLCFDYGWPIARHLGEWLPQSLVIVGLLAASVVLCFRRSWIGFAGVFFFLFLAPTSSFVPILDPAFEHRVYLPLVVPLLFAVVGGRAVLARLAPGAAGRLAPALVAAAALVLAGLTVRRNRDYRSSVVLLELTAKQAPLSARVHATLADSLLSEGRAEEAIPEFLEALRLDYRDGFISDTVTPGVYQKLATAFVRTGELERALPYLESATKVVGGAADFVFYGNVLQMLEKHERAAAEFEKALELQPDDASTHVKLGRALVAMGRTGEARTHYDEALRLSPRQDEAHLALVELLSAQGDPSAALEHAREAIAIEPNTVTEYFDLGRLLGMLGHYGEAMAALREAMRVAPDLPAPCAAFARAVCLKTDATPEERQEALRASAKAIELTNSAVAGFLEVGALAHAAVGDFAEAASLLETALALPESDADAALDDRLRKEREDYLRRAASSGSPRD